MDFYTYTEVDRIERQRQLDKFPFWVPVPGLEKYYEVSKRGKVRSLGRVSTSVNMYGPYTKVYKSKMLSLTRNSTEYFNVKITRADGSPKRMLVHVLVAMAFLGSYSW